LYRPDGDDWNPNFFKSEVLKMKRLLLVAAVLGVAIFALGCPKGPTEPPKPKPPVTNPIKPAPPGVTKPEPPKAGPAAVEPGKNEPPKSPVPVTGPSKPESSREEPKPK
jgi:hypothetical protein